ncbi:MAG TPA: transposase [Vicinamibacterales bacterium]|nr:transposase [Vicinamibacterales bacterium]
MPRIHRSAPDGLAHHVINRGNNRKTVFHKVGDYQAFLRFMREAQDRIAIRILAFCLMPTHFHIVFWPETMASLSAYMRLLMNAHVRNYHQHYGTCGHGHIWQGRFKNFPIQHDVHLLRVLRYVEANAGRAHLVRQSEDWRWGSLAAPGDAERPELSDSPVARPDDWLDYVNDPVGQREMDSLRRSVRRGAPYGEPAWTESVAKTSGLEFTLRPPGRPRRDTQPAALVVSTT